MPPAVWYDIAWYEILGLAGIAMSIGAYARLQWRRDFAKTLTYSVINLVSAIMVGVSLWFQWNTASFIGNLLFGFISVYGVYRCINYRLRGVEAPY